ncbi:TniQ family protein [Brevibacillus brevis]|uniref:TniQ family protein n=1 Tax=Brevibacillus brevis TaxID=1393 RepID=UPI00339B709F
MQRYPDENFYSICARLHFYSGEKERITNLRLFGHVETTNHILWPNRLYYFSEKLGIDPMVILVENTIFPYFSKFLTEEKIGKLKNAMLFGDNKANPSSIVAQNQDKLSQIRLMLCPMCAQEDFSKYGEPYWHRSHHLPGTRVCYKHNVFLVSECPTCKVPLSTTSNKGLKLPSFFCKNGHSLSMSKENSDEKLWLIAQENHYFLHLKQEL